MGPSAFAGAAWDPPHPLLNDPGAIVAMPIRFYDMELELTRDAVQEDWDRLWRLVERKHREICELQALLRACGIALPAGHVDRAGEFYWLDV